MMAAVMAPMLVCDMPALRSLFTSRTWVWERRATLFGGEPTIWASLWLPISMLTLTLRQTICDGSASSWESSELLVSVAEILSRLPEVVQTAGGLASGRKSWVSGR